MKIYKTVKISIKTGKVIQEDSYDYSGELSLMKGGSGTTTTATPEWQTPYLQDVANQAQGLNQQPLSYYPGTTVAGFTPAQSLAQNATINRALTGSPLLGQAQQNTMDTMQGKYLDPNSNPYLKDTYDMGARSLSQNYNQNVMPAIKQGAAGAGAFGGSRQGVAEAGASNALAQQLSNLATTTYGQNYTTERGNQVAATNAAPAMAQQDYYDIGQLAAAGEEQQGMNQANIDAAIKQYQWQQLEPQQRLGMYSNLVSGNYGGTTQSMSSGK
jgi:hypothetical protein